MAQYTIKQWWPQGDKSTDQQIARLSDPTKALALLLTTDLERIANTLLAGPQNISLSRSLMDAELSQQMGRLTAVEAFGNVKFFYHDEAQSPKPRLSTDLIRGQEAFATYVTAAKAFEYSAPYLRFAHDAFRALSYRFDESRNDWMLTNKYFEKDTMAAKISEVSMTNHFPSVDQLIEHLLKSKLGRYDPRSLDDGKYAFHESYIRQYHSLGGYGIIEYDQQKLTLLNPAPQTEVDPRSPLFASLPRTEKGNGVVLGYRDDFGNKLIRPVDQLNVPTTEAYLGNLSFVTLQSDSWKFKVSVDDGSYDHGLHPNRGISIYHYKDAAQALFALLQQGPPAFYWQQPQDRNIATLTDRSGKLLATINMETSRGMYKPVFNLVPTAAFRHYYPNLLKDFQANSYYPVGTVNSTAYAMTHQGVEVTSKLAEHLSTKELIRDHKLYEGLSTRYKLDRPNYIVQIHHPLQPAQQEGIHFNDTLIHNLHFHRFYDALDVIKQLPGKYFTGKQENIDGGQPPIQSAAIMVPYKPAPLAVRIATPGQNQSANSQLHIDQNQLSKKEVRTMEVVLQKTPRHPSLNIYMSTDLGKYLQMATPIGNAPKKKSSKKAAPKKNSSGRKKI